MSAAEVMAPVKGELRVYSQEERMALIEVEREERFFELAQRRAKVYAGSSMVPKHYQNNIGNVMIAENIARRMRADVLMVMQNLYIVSGTPAWSSQFLIATFNVCGRFAPVRYRFSGAEGTDDYGCEAVTRDLESGEEIVGTKVTWKMAREEGWSTKGGSKWKTMPGQMFRYRSAAFLVRSTAPEISMGLLTKEELEDVHGESETPKATAGVKAKTTADLADVLKKRNEVVAEESDDSPAGSASIFDCLLSEIRGVKDPNLLEPLEADVRQEPSLSDSQRESLMDAIESAKDQFASKV
jgi:hypothetical protein